MCRQIVLGLALAALVLSGCQSARYVARDNETGVIAVPAGQPGWLPRSRKTAEKMMAAHFPDGYEIIKEEEVVLGEVTTGDVLPAEEESELLIRPVAATRHVHRAGKAEYRIYYRRTGG